MPMPVSATASSIHSRPSATLRTRSATSPSFVNLQALLKRLSRNLGLSAFGMNAEWHVLRRGERGRHIVDRGDAQYVPVLQVQYADLGTAEPSCIRQAWS